jgi:hypothetical protein
MTDVSPDDEDWLENQGRGLRDQLVASKWWTNHTGWLVVSVLMAVPLALVVTKSWWFLLGFPIALVGSFVVQRILTGIFVAVARGRIHDHGREITWPGNLFLFVVIPVMLLAHLLGKL